MALTWDLSNIANKDDEGVCWRTAEQDNEGRGEVKGERYMTATLEALIWNCMAIGMGKIEEKTLDRYVKRTRFYEHVFGPWRRGLDEQSGTIVPKPLTREEIARYVGLRTNASTLTDSQFANLMFRNFR